MVKNIDRWVIGASFSFLRGQKTGAGIRAPVEGLGDGQYSLLDWLQARVQRSLRVKTGAQICFQVAEDVVAQHLKQAKHAGRFACAAPGAIRFAVDHVGTGRDSAQLIKHVPMDFVKIDGSLMQGLHRDQECQKQVAELATLARNQQIHTIAERVEDANTMAVLWQLGIAHIQGNYMQMHGVVLEDTQTVRGLSAGGS